MTLARPKIGTSSRELALETYQATGNLSKAAAAAGMKRRELVGLRETDSEFDAEMQDALESYLDGLEESLAQIARGQVRAHPVAAFGILKAHRPRQWHEKVAAVQVNVNQGPAFSPEEVRRLFADSLALATEDSKRALAAGDAVVDAE